ncbi:MAG: TonB-dependent receptor [Gammaproteobacteria bacterium]|nr:TonB-dependent receptor [Gammaproteobacteria bacterium]
MRFLRYLYAAIFTPLVSLSLIFSGSVNAAVLEEIIVTAQKREQNLQDVGISVTAFSGQQLDNLGATNTTDITQQSPAVQLFTYTPSIIVFNIRGVSQNNFIDTLEAPVAVNFDNAYVASMNGIGQQMFDMDRVEVLRGPQGTLFGRNATGGVIQYFTNAPDEEEANGYIKAGAAEYENFFVEGAVGGALAPNLRGRFAGRWEQADGYTESVTPGVRDTNGKDGFALRGALQMDVTEDLMVDLKVYYSEDNDAPTGGYVAYASKADRETGYSATPEASPITGDVHKHANGIEGSLDREVTSVTGQITWDLNEHLQVVSITNYMDIYKNYYEDAGGGYIPNFPYNPVAETEQITQELRLSGDYDRFRWQLGGYYMDLEITGMDFVSGEFVSFLPEGRLDADWNLDSENWSVFGQVEVDLSEQVTLIGGVRYSMDDKQYSLVNSAAGEGAFLDPVTYIPPGEVFFDSAWLPPEFTEIDYNDWAARAQLDWRPNDDLLVYAAFNRGIKGGNFTTFFSAPENLQHKEEVLYSYEAGFKRTFPEQAMRLNATGFYYDYKNYQAFGLIAAFPEIRNTDAEAYGGEIELAWSPAERLDLVAGISFIDSEIDEVPTVQDFFGIVLPLQHIENNELPNAPSFSINFLARHTWPFAGGELAFQIDGNYNDDQYLDVFNSAASREEAYFIGNLRLTYITGDDKWELGAFVRNFTDTKHRLYLLDLAAGDLFVPPDVPPTGDGIIEQVYGPPRWAGGFISYRF